MNTENTHPDGGGLFDRSLFNIAALAQHFGREERWIREKLIRPQDHAGLPCRAVGDDYFTTREELSRWITLGLENYGGEPDAENDDPGGNGRHEDEDRQV